MCTNLAEAIELAHQTDPMPFILGGTEIYQESFPLVTHLFLTEIDSTRVSIVVFCGAVLSV